MEPKDRINALFEQGNAIQVDTNIPVKRYFRSGIEMAKMAAIYECEGNLENAFMLYVRYLTLFLNKIKEHPQYETHSPEDKQIMKKKLREVTPKAEALKLKIVNKYQEEYNEFISQQKAAEESLRLQKEEVLRKKKELEENVSENSISNKEKFDNLYIAPYSDSLSENNSLGNLTYPTAYLSGGSDASAVADSTKALVPKSVPEVSSPFVPPRELKPQYPQSTPVVNRGTKPPSLLCANQDQKGGSLRTILVPQQLMDRFLTLASSNTSKNVETCGILAGKLELNKFLITHLLVPQQVGTADSCTTQSEEEIFDQQDKFDLITLGWIHTHPTQTAFLSSVDLHTHCSYQLMMPEAVAIVCAPKFQETGYFTLTPNHGLQFIANCRESGFHPHPSEPPLFQTSDHIKIDNSLAIQVIDLRR